MGFNSGFKGLTYCSPVVTVAGVWSVPTTRCIRVLSNATQWSYVSFDCHNKTAVICMNRIHRLLFVRDTDCVFYLWGGNQAHSFAGYVIRPCVVPMICDFCVWLVAHQMNKQFSELQALKLLVSPQLSRAGMLQLVQWLCYGMGGPGFESL